MNEDTNSNNLFLAGRRLHYIANIRLPTEKAHGIQIMKMCEAFSAVGHQVTLVVPTRFNHIQDDPFSYYGVKRSFKIVRLYSVDLVRFGTIGFKFHALTFAVSSFFFSQFARRSMIFSRDESLLLPYALLGKDYIWEVHSKRLNGMTRFVGTRARYVVAISGGVRDFLEGHGISPEKIVCAHDGVDVSEFADQPDKEGIRQEFDIPQKAFVVGYIGKYRTMGETKGVEELISAFSEFYATRQGTHLLLVGLNTDEVEEVRMRCVEAGLSSGSYSLKTHVRHRDAIRLMQCADVLVMNYPEREHYAKYMSPLKLFEYMASGVPIITTDLPVIREVLSEEAALFVPPGDSYSLATAFGAIATDAAYAERIAGQAKNEAAAYAWEKRASRILK